MSKATMTTPIDQRDLVKCVRTYRSLDEKLKELNKQVYKLREDRKFVESEMSDILNRPHFQGFSKLEIQDDGSHIRIDRPGSWKKPWSMSAKDLQGKLNEYFKQASRPNAEECSQFIIENRKKELISKDFAFTRMLSVEDNDETPD